MKLRVVDESDDDYLFLEEMFLPIELTDAIQRRIELAA